MLFDGLEMARALPYTVKIGNKTSILVRVFIIIQVERLCTDIPYSYDSAKFILKFLS